MKFTVDKKVPLDTFEASIEYTYDNGDVSHDLRTWEDWQELCNAHFDPLEAVKAAKTYDEAEKELKEEFDYFKKAIAKADDFGEFEIDWAEEIEDYKESFNDLEE